MNLAVMQCYFLSRPADEEGKPVRGYRKWMYSIWKERQGLKVIEQMLCDQVRMVRMNGWLTALAIDVIIKRMINENAENND